MKDQEGAGPLNETELKACWGYKERNYQLKFYKKSLVSLTVTICLGSSDTSHLLIGVVIIMDEGKAYKPCKGILINYYLYPLMWEGLGAGGQKQNVWDENTYCILQSEGENTHNPAGNGKAWLHSDTYTSLHHKSTWLIARGLGFLWWWKLVGQKPAHSFIQSVNKYLLSVYHAPDTVWGVGDMAMKLTKYPYSCSLHPSGGHGL